MNRDDKQLPFRQATRLVNEFQLDIGTMGLEAAGLDLDRMATLLMIHRMALRTPGAARISVNAVAASLKRPTETIRRATLALTAMGYCEKSLRALHRAPGFRTLPAIARLEAQVGRRFVRLLDSFERSGFVLPERIREQGDDAALAAALDIYLSVFELAEARIRRPMDFHVVGAIAVLNAALITHDPILSRRYGHDRTVPPERLRCPVTIRDLIRLHGFPHTTLWRHVSAMEAQGALRKVPSGYLLSDCYMDDPQTSARSRVKIGYVRRVLGDLAGGRLSPRMGDSPAEA